MNNKTMQSAVAKSLRDLILTEKNRLHLQGRLNLKVDHVLPANIASLLERIDRAERSRCRDGILAYLAEI